VATFCFPLNHPSNQDQSFPAHLPLPSTVKYLFSLYLFVSQRKTRGTPPSALISPTLDTQCPVSPDSFGSHNRHPVTAGYPQSTQTHHPNPSWHPLSTQTHRSKSIRIPFVHPHSLPKIYPDSLCQPTLTIKSDPDPFGPSTLDTLST